MVIRLGCLRGVSMLTAFGLAVEIGDWSDATCSHHRAPLMLLVVSSTWITCASTIND